MVTRNPEMGGVMRITHKQLIMVVASLVLVIAVAGSVALARRSAPHLVPLKSIPTSKNTGGPPWEPSLRGGATRSALVSSPLCTPTQLETQYWTTFPAMDNQMSGFNLINRSGQACSLPVYPSSVYLANADGTPAKVPLLPGPAGEKGSSDFLAYGTPKAPAIPSFAIPLSPAPITLAPGGTAVDILFGTVGVNEQPGDPPCISTPVGVSIALSLRNESPVHVYMPAKAGTSKSLIDPTGAPFSSCTAAAFSPFLTWSAASHLVGAPYTRTSQGDLPLKYTSAFINAP
jgi:hypothetical protein